MKPEVFNCPLKIVHGFPRKAGMTDSEIRAKITDKLTELKEKGFGGVVSNVPFNNYTKSPEEWARFRFIADECARLGLRLWIYDENGYPSGGAGGMTVDANPDYECTGVVIVTRELEAKESCDIELPRGHMHFLRIAVYKTTGGLDGITDFEPTEVIPCRLSTETQRVENKTDGKAVVCAFIQKRLYEGTHAEHNVCDCRRYIDVTYSEAVREFIRNTYEKYYENISDRLLTTDQGGKISDIGGVEAIFTDEPSLMGCYINAGLYPHSVHDQYDDTLPLYPAISWGHDFENTFKSLCGYDCLDGLIYKFVRGGDAGKKYRYDYHKVLSHLFEQNFFAQISDFCASHGLNFSGHILLEDDIRQHVLFEGNFFSFLRHMHYPGIDMLQSIPELIFDQYAFTPKLISSVAKAYDRRHVMSEVSAHAQGGNVTIPQQYASVCLQYALGVDIFTYYYDENFMDKDTYLKYNHSHGRIDTVMAGQTLSDVMLYYPIETFQMHHLGSDRQYGVYMPEENACHDSLQAIMNRLTNSQIGFDFADYEHLSHCRIKDGKLITPTGAEYNALLLPAMEYTSELRGLLSDLSAQGLKILSLSDALFADCAYGKVFKTAEQMINSLDRSDFSAYGANCSGRMTMLARDTQNGRAFLFVNADNSENTVEISLRGMDSPVLYSPLEDTELPADVSKTADGHKVRFTVGAYDSLIIKEA